MSASSNPLPWEVSPSHVRKFCEFCKRNQKDLDKHINTKHLPEARAKYPGRCCEVCGQYFSKGLQEHRQHEHNLGRNPLHNLANAAEAAANEETDTDENRGRSRSRSRSRSPRRNRTKNNKKGGYRRKTRHTKKYRTRRH
jgi:hypothetical protein